MTDFPNEPLGWHDTDAPDEGLTMTQTKDSTTGEREEIARIIDPSSWELFDAYPTAPGAQKYVEPSLTKADAILSRPSRMAASSEGEPVPDPKPARVEE